MKTEAEIRELLDLRMKEYEETEHFDFDIDVDRRLIKDLLWILDDPRFDDW